ncbi:hypothetical protein ILYODFUR_029705 [Ilyodon furcidens]|uniref:Uncharacterized protein n=1 Tax=Ilyodon furcidens TaxID=33524 RepID=A0ABV0TNX6_9TELE
MVTSSCPGPTDGSSLYYNSVTAAGFTSDIHHSIRILVSKQILRFVIWKEGCQLTASSHTQIFSENKDKPFHITEGTPNSLSAKKATPPLQFLMYCRELCLGCKQGERQTR